MPNTNPANPSGQDDNGADRTNDSPDVSKEAGGSDNGETLDAIVQRRVQSVVDRDIEFLKSGRTNEMNPKTQQLIAEALKLMGNDSGKAADDDDDDDSPSYLPQRKGTKESRLEQIGRKALQEKLLSEVRTEMETQVIGETWAEDVRALFAEFKDVKLDPNDELVLKVTAIDNRKLYPASKEGWKKWRADAQELRRKYVNAQKTAGSEDAGDDGAAGADADRNRGQNKKRPPNPSGSGGSEGTGLQAVVKAAADMRAGKITKEQYLEVLNKNRTH